VALKPALGEAQSKALTEQIVDLSAVIGAGMTSAPSLAGEDLENPVAPELAGVGGRMDGESRIDDGDHAHVPPIAMRRWQGFLPGRPLCGLGGPSERAVDRLQRVDPDLRSAVRVPAAAGFARRGPATQQRKSRCGA
jgi:hypothetical protein